jgi:hypothetical protein
VLQSGAWRRTVKSEKLESVIQLRIYDDLRAKLQREADAEVRPLSQYIRLVLIRHVEELEKERAELRHKKEGAK